MNVRNFVALSAVLLACWLGVSYLRPVSEKHYPLIGKPAGAESSAGLGAAGGEQRETAQAVGSGAALVAGH
jgi:hypothetical protein